MKYPEGKWDVPTESYGLPTGQARANFDARISNELKAFKDTNGKIDLSKFPPASKEFTQAFTNGAPKNYRIEVSPNGEHKVMVQKADDTWHIATESYGLPTGQARANYDARIQLELGKLANV